MKKINSLIFALLLSAFLVTPTVIPKTPVLNLAIETQYEDYSDYNRILYD